MAIRGGRTTLSRRQVRKHGPTAAQAAKAEQEQADWENKNYLGSTAEAKRRRLPHQAEQKEGVTVAQAAKNAENREKRQARHKKAQAAKEKKGR